MKKMSLACVFGTVLILAGCSTSVQKKTENTDNNVKQANTESDVDAGLRLDDIENYRSKVIDQIAANKETIVDLQLRMDYIKPRGSAKETYTKQINALEQKNNDLKKKIENYSGNGKADWEKFKIEVNSDMNKLAEAFEEISANDIKKFD